MFYFQGPVFTCEGQCFLLFNPQDWFFIAWWDMTGFSYLPLLPVPFSSTSFFLCFFFSSPFRFLLASGLLFSARWVSKIGNVEHTFFFFKSWLGKEVEGKMWGNSHGPPDPLLRTLLWIQGRKSQMIIYWTYLSQTQCSESCSLKKEIEKYYLFICVCFFY